MISEDQVKHVAYLARLSLKPEETELFTRQLNEILAYIEQLNEVPTKDVEPTLHVIDLINVFRNDNVKRIVQLDTILTNAPETEHSYFVVPRIIK